MYHFDFKVWQSYFEVKMVHVRTQLEQLAPGQKCPGAQLMQFQWHTMSFIWQMAKWQKAARKYADKEETYHLEFIDKGLDRSWGFGQMAKWQKAKAGGLRQLGQRATTWCAQTALCRGKAGRGNRKTAPRRALQDGRCQIF